MHRTHPSTGCNISDFLALSLIGYSMTHDGNGRILKKWLREEKSPVKVASFDESANDESEASVVMIGVSIGPIGLVALVWQLI